MYTVNFYNFGYTKEFKYPDQALRHAQNSGFECVVYDPNYKRIAKFGSY